MFQKNNFKIAGLIVLQLFFLSYPGYCRDFSVEYSTLSAPITINNVTLASFFADAKSFTFSRRVIVPNKLGIHTRVRTVLSFLANKYPDATRIYIKDLLRNRIADVRDIKSLSSINVEQGAEVLVIARGSQADKAVSDISDFIQNLAFFDSDEDIAYTFEDAEADPVVMGKKGANLVRMFQSGIPIPEGFVIVADKDFHEQALRGYLEINLKKFMPDFDDKNCVVSVRSSPMYSAPGMLDTILNVGMNSAIVESLGEQGKGWQLYAAYIKDFSTKVFNIDQQLFDQIKIGDDYKKLAEEYSVILRQEIKKRGICMTAENELLPLSFGDQLIYTVTAVRNTNKNPGVATFMKALGRENKELPNAVIVQKMVFATGSGGDGSFTLSTVDGESEADKLIIDFAGRLQGTAVVNGQVKYNDLSQSKIDQNTLNSIKTIVKKIQEIFNKSYIQIEGVIKGGRVYILQCRDNNGSQKIFVKNSNILGINKLTGKTLLANNPGKDIRGVVFKPQGYDNLPNNIKAPVFLAFEYADTSNAAILLDEVINKKRNIAGVITEYGASQTHFLKQVELLNMLGYDIAYITGIDIGLLNAGDEVVLKPDQSVLALPESSESAIRLNDGFLPLTLLNQSI